MMWNEIQVSFLWFVHTNIIMRLIALDGQQSGQQTNMKTAAKKTTHLQCYANMLL